MQNHRSKLKTVVLWDRTRHLLFVMWKRRYWETVAIVRIITLQHFITWNKISSNYIFNPQCQYIHYRGNLTYRNQLSPQTTPMLQFTTLRLFEYHHYFVLYFSLILVTCSRWAWMIFVHTRSSIQTQMYTMFTRNLARMVCKTFWQHSSLKWIVLTF